MAVLDWTDAVKKKFPCPEKIDRDMVEVAGGQVLQMRGSVRMMTGRISTTDEIEYRREEAKKPLLG